MLNVFLEAARKLNTSGVLDDVLHTLLEAALRLTRAERGFVFLRQADGELRLAAGRDKNGERIDDDSTISRSVLRDAAKSASEFLVTDTDDTGKLAGRESVVAHNLHSVICIPLRKTVIQEKVKDDTKSGETSTCRECLYLDAHFLSGKLSSVSHDILRTIANGAATLVENAALVQAEDAAKRVSPGTGHCRRDPAAPDDRDRARCAVRQGQRRQLCLQRHWRRLLRSGVHRQGLVADRRRRFRQRRFGGGGGFHPARHAVFAVGARFVAAGDDLPPSTASCARRWRDRNTRRWSLRACWSNGDLELINCGHVPPMLVSGGNVTKLEEGNLPVGLVPVAEFQATRLQLKPGDRLLLVTDGVTEAEDADGEFFGTERLEACCLNGFAAIEEAVTAFRGDTPLTDDFTITEMIYRGAQESSA